jgi:lipoyl(octanoyl) transferase
MTATPRRTLRAGFLGRIPYAEGLALQLAARDGIKRGTGPEHLFLLEHPHVYTLGRNASAGDVVAAPAALVAQGVEVADCDRGGQVTYHGPGQLVGYPVLNLSPDRRDVRRYVRDLEETLIRTLAGYGVEGRVRAGQEHVGVWVGEAKIASIGVHLSRWITTHGFALNVTTDLSLFAGIVACGLPGVEMTSIERLTGARPPLAEVAERYARIFAEVFDRRLAPLEVGQGEPAAIAAIAAIAAAAAS